MNRPKRLQSLITHHHIMINKRQPIFKIFSQLQQDLNFQQTQIIFPITTRACCHVTFVKSKVSDLLQMWKKGNMMHFPIVTSGRAGSSKTCIKGEPLRTVG